MEIDKISNAIAKSKLPTITIVFFLLWFGADLITDSKEQTFQSPGVIIGSGLTWIATIIIAMLIPSFRDKEKMEFIFINQEKAIESLSEALEKTNKTSIAREKQTQNELKSKGFGKATESGEKEYAVEEDDKTRTS